MNHYNIFIPRNVSKIAEKISKKFGSAKETIDKKRLHSVCSQQRKKGGKRMAFRLRPWQTSDAQSLAVAADNLHIAQWLRNAFPHPYTVADGKWYISDCLAKEGEGQMSRAIEVDGQAVGSIGIVVQSDVYAKSGELGYWLAENYWHQGIMTQAVLLICREAFETLGLLRIFAQPFADNQGSRRVLQKAGFTYEGTMRSGVYKNGQIHDYCMYALLKGELGQGGSYDGTNCNL